MPVRLSEQKPNIRLSGQDRKALAALIKTDINAYCKAAYDDGPRSHLGGSLIGEECARKLAMMFRWMAREDFTAKMLRLFNRGHREEARFVEWLSGIGAKVSDLDEHGNQARMTFHSGHYGGSLDGRAMLPERYNLPITFLTEFKTHNDKSFTKLVKLGVKLSKPLHYNQMCSYGDAFELQYALYFAINKNDDEIYIEVVELDLALGKRNNNVKSLAIITAPKLPPKIAANPAYEACKYCPCSDVCHNGKPADVNCRSCRYSQPINDNAKWYCHRWQAIIPKEAIPAACGHWVQFQ